jgi:hypothetical protein
MEHRLFTIILNVKESNNNWIYYIYIIPVLENHLAQGAYLKLGKNSD